MQRKRRMRRLRLLGIGISRKSFIYRISEQDYGAQMVFRKAFECATSIEPTFQKDLVAETKKLRRVEQTLRRQANVLNSVGMNRELRT